MLNIEEGVWCKDVDEDEGCFSCVAGEGKVISGKGKRLRNGEEWSGVRGVELDEERRGKTMKARIGLDLLY